MYTYSNAPYRAFAIHAAEIEKLIAVEDASETLEENVEACETASLPATEGLGIIYSLADFFGRIANNLKTYLIKGFKSFKRSELRAYTESHAASVRKVLKDKTIDLEGVKVNIPDGMKTTYPEVTAFLSDWQSQMDMATCITDTLTYLSNYSKLSIDEWDKLTRDTGALTKKLQMVSMKEIEKDLRKYFSTAHTSGKFKAEVVIGSYVDLIEVHKTVEHFETSYMTASNIISSVDEIEVEIGKIVESLKQVTVSTAYLKSFHGLISTLAEQLDMFGAFLDYAQRVEHNYVLALRDIISARR